MKKRLNSVLTYSPVYSILLVLLFSACSTNQKIETSTPIGSINYTEPHIAFFLFQLKDAGSDISVLLSQKIVSKGRLKPAHINSAELKDQSWEAVILDQAKEEIVSHNLGNPFIYSAEVVNEDGVLERKEVGLEEAELAFRMPVDKGSRYLELRSLRGGELLVHHSIDLLQ